MDESNLNCLSDETGQRQVHYYKGLELYENCGHVIPNVDEVEDGTAQELRQVWIRMEAAG